MHNCVFRLNERPHIIITSTPSHYWNIIYHFYLPPPPPPLSAATKHNSIKNMKHYTCSGALVFRESRWLRWHKVRLRPRWLRSPALLRLCSLRSHMTRARSQTPEKIYLDCETGTPERALSGNQQSHNHRPGAQ